MSKYMFAITTISTGGAERVVSILSTALTRLGQEVDVIKFFEVEGEYPVGENVKVINLSGGNTEDYNKLSFSQKAKLLREIIKKEEPDYVIPYTFPVASIIAIATRGLRTKVLQSIRIDPAKGPANKYKRKMRDYLVKKSPCTFVQNEDQKNYFNKSLHNKIHVLFNPVNEDLFSVRQKEEGTEFKIVSMGRLGSQKNFPLLIESFCEAFEFEERVSLDIYGEGSDKQMLQNLIDEKGLGKKVVLKGRTNDIKKVYESADMFVLSSNFEGMPNALIEAMACGVPSISTDCPTGPSDIIKPDYNGILVPVGDIKELSQAMKTLYCDAEKRSMFSANGKKTIRDICAADSIADQMITICESI